MAESIPTSWHCLPTEIRVLIMSRIPDILSLHNFVCAEVDSSAAIFSEFFADILPGVLGQSIPLDIQESIYIWISVKDAAPFRDTGPESSCGMAENVYYDKKKRLFQFHQKPKDPIRALHQLSRIMIAIEFFMCLYPEFFACRHKDFEDKDLNSIERHRLQRALWRFEVCSALKQAWQPPGEGSFQLGRDTCVSHIVDLLSKHQPWEIEELTSVYDFLEITAFQYYPRTLPSNSRRY